ncbi:MAG: YciI family protein [Fimbriimonadaceae bacterium]
MSHGQITSEYMLLMRGTNWGEGLSPEEIQEGLVKFFAWVDDLKQQGTLKAGQPLLPVGRVVTAKRGQSVADGPFVETKEAVGGYLLVQVEHLDAAVAIARKCPVLEYGLYIEVRTVAEMCPLADEQDIQPAQAMA